MFATLHIRNSLDSSVGTVMGYGLHGRDSMIQALPAVFCNYSAERQFRFVFLSTSSVSGPTETYGVECYNDQRVRIGKDLKGNGPHQI
jgi:hypothetical protein